MVAVVGGVVVVGGVTARAFLMVSGNPGVDERSGQPGSASAGSGKIVNIGDVGVATVLVRGAGRRLWHRWRLGDVFCWCPFADCHLEQSHRKAIRVVE